eukprot:313895-Rhodomonas_salina.3
MNSSEVVGVQVVLGLRTADVVIVVVLGCLFCLCIAHALREYATGQQVRGIWWYSQMAPALGDVQVGQCRGRHGSQLPLWLQETCSCG